MAFSVPLAFLSTSILNLEVAINEWFYYLNFAYSGNMVSSDALATPPATPVVGLYYIVPVGASVAWGNPEGSIVVWTNASWFNLGVPVNQMVAYVEGSPPTRIRWDGTAWVAFP
jgi:hypothetical protein